MTFTTRLRPRYDAPRKHQPPSTNHQGGSRRKLTKLSGFLDDIGGKRLGQTRLPDGTRPTIWVIRNHDRWAAVSKDERTIARGYQRPDEASLA
jgi:hypothetical protein